jgi:hypothetical protein
MEKDNIILNNNCIPICSDIFSIILSYLNLRDLKNFSLSCRKHYVESNKNFVWMNQMIRFYPALEVCCNSVAKNCVIKYKDVVKEIISLQYCGSCTRTTWFQDHISKAIINIISLYNNNKYPNINLMVNNYISNNLHKFNEEFLNIVFTYYCEYGCTKMVKLLLKYWYNIEI